MSEPFQQFWGKARPHEGASASWHPAAFHALDVAAVAERLLLAHPARASVVLRACAWPLADFCRVVVFLVALHDLGKFSRPFQAKAPEHWPPVLGCFGLVPGPRHDAVGLGLLQDDAVLDTLDGVLPDWHDRMKPVLAAIAAHHGQPVQAPKLDPLTVCDACRSAARHFVAAVAKLIAPPALAPPPRGGETVFGWWLAGLTTLCDWIGSATHWFDYAGDAPSSLAEYWVAARRRAEIAVGESGLLPATPGPWRGLAGLMPKIVTPTPVQALAESVSLPEGPVCIVIEDATGSGKTEAAVLLAHRLVVTGRADGLFLALPTMATADAMFDRLAESYRRMFAGQARPSLALAHGRASLNELFQGSILARAEVGTPGEAADDAQAGSAQCAAWLAEERRRVFFADVGVGTIDQALLGVLAARHAALRLFGLSRKVLVVDEAHAYDPYMAEELDRLLQFHAMLGGSSIVLSATLPQARRAGLLAAAARGLGGMPFNPVATEYPLVTIVGRGAGAEHHAPMREVLRRNLPVRRLSGMAEAVAALASAARAGACGIWIRNTVDDACEAAAALRAEGLAPILFHARFAMGDRLAIQAQVLRWFGKDSDTASRAPDGVGRVLIATQVVEQSLDLDADVMVSDLAPIELLIQRAGRLQRHPDRMRPAGFAVPELWVVSPAPVATPAAEWAADAAIGNTRYVYAPHVLWRSARVLFAEGSIITPGGVRDLVEAVHGEAAELMPTALEASQSKAEGQAFSHRGQARFNMLEPAKGYRFGNGQWESDIVMPTRLGDDYRVFRMARLEGARLVPLCDADEPDKAWALSEIALRSSIADGESVPTHVVPALTRLRNGWSVWQREIQVLVLESDGDNGWTIEAARHTEAVRLGYTSRGGLYKIAP